MYLLFTAHNPTQPLWKIPQELPVVMSRGAVPHVAWAGLAVSCVESQATAFSWQRHFFLYSLASPEHTILPRGDSAMMSTKRIALRINSIQLNLAQFTCVQFSWTQLSSAQFIPPSPTHGFSKYFLDVKVYVGIGGPAGVTFTN